MRGCVCVCNIYNNPTCKFRFGLMMAFTVQLLTDRTCWFDILSAAFLKSKFIHVTDNVIKLSLLVTNWSSWMPLALPIILLLFYFICYFLVKKQNTCKYVLEGRCAFLCWHDPAQYNTLYIGVIIHIRPHPLHHFHHPQSSLLNTVQPLSRKYLFIL